MRPTDLPHDPRRSAKLAIAWLLACLLLAFGWKRTWSGRHSERLSYEDCMDLLRQGTPHVDVVVDRTFRYLDAGIEAIEREAAREGESGARARLKLQILRDRLR